MKRPIPYLRWWICGLLFLATTVNYLDRTCLSVLKETIAKEFNMSDDDYANIIIAFMIAYAVGHMVSGRIIDWIGTRMGYLVAFLAWSAASIAHAFCGGVGSFALSRFALGVGESGNFPAAIKAVSEWFPRQERALATGIVNVGSGVGAMIAPWIIYVIMDKKFLGLGWREAFVGTGLIGIFWAVLWLWLYRPPAQHPRIAETERVYIEAGLERGSDKKAAEHIPWLSLFRYPQLWGMIAIRVFSDPVWWFWVTWLPGYLQKHRGFSLGDLAAFAWIPFFASDFGSVAGGALSTFFSRRMPVLQARKRALVCCAAVMPLAIWAGLTSSSTTVIVLVSIAAFGHQAWAASALTLPADIFPSKYVGSVYGITAMAGGVGGIVFTKIVGMVSTQYHTFVPIFIAAGVMHITGVTLGSLLIRKPVLEEEAIASEQAPALTTGTLHGSETV